MGAPLVLTALKFVQGAVSKKDFVPALSHFCIRDGRIMGYNGKMSLSAPIGLDIDCCPKAEPFVRAVQACEETAQLHLTPAGKLAIRSGKFRAFVDCLPEPYPDIHPEGMRIEVNGELLPVLEMLLRFTAEDASRPWASSVLLCGDCAYATNNVIAVERWLGYHFPYVLSVPRFAVRELLRIGEEPTYLQATQTSLTVHFAGDRWLHTQLSSIEWPDIPALLGALVNIHAGPLPTGLFEALDTVAAFPNAEGRVYLAPGVATTGRAEDEGAAVEVPELKATGVFNLEMLQLLDGVATLLGLENHPAPCPFFGDKLRGAIIGMRE